MKIDRKSFLKVAGLGTAGMIVKPSSVSAKADIEASVQEGHVQRFNMHGFRAPKLDRVRLGFIGIGNRGSGTVTRFARIEGVEIKALCDIVPNRVNRVATAIKKYSHNPVLYTDGENAWKKLCERDDIDFVIVSTPWHLHAPQSAYAMECGKHVALEIPGVKTLEECWQLVETSERTKKHCMLLANSAFGDFNILVLNMARQGFFGEIVHGEGAYIHDRATLNSQWKRDLNNEGWFLYRPWRLKENISRNGNLYAAHGLGSVCQVMDINYGDKMEYMVSMSGNDFTLGPKMREMAEIDKFYEPYTGLKFRGNMNTSIIRTYRGRTIMLQHDISTVRPGVRFNMISGTKGIAQQTPEPPKIATGHEWLSNEEYKALEAKYTPEISKKAGAMAKQMGGHGGVDAMLAWRIIDCLRNGLPCDVDVYDVALWSSICPLSEWSVVNRSNSVNIPDFTSGSWRTNERGMDINMELGGGSTKFL